jgi:spore coat protein F
VYQQLQTQQNIKQTIMPDKDLAYTVLADLKRVISEYATAATESSCQQIRQTFTQLLNSSLTLQGQLYKTMEQQGMYTPASPALRQEVDKQIRSCEQTAQQTQQHLQQFGVQIQAAGQAQYSQQLQYQQPFIQNQSNIQQYSYNQNQASNQLQYAQNQHSAQHHQHQQHHQNQHQRQHAFATQQKNNQYYVLNSLSYIA